MCQLNVVQIFLTNRFYIMWQQSGIKIFFLAAQKRKRIYIFIHIYIVYKKMMGYSLENIYNIQHIGPGYFFFLFVIFVERVLSSLKKIFTTYFFHPFFPPFFHSL